jgi:hypothetical protein
MVLSRAATSDSLVASASFSTRASCFKATVVRVMASTLASSLASALASARPLTRQ